MHKWTGEPSSSLCLPPSFSLKGIETLERKKKGNRGTHPCPRGECASLMQQTSTCFSLFPSMCFAHLVLCILSSTRKRDKTKARRERAERRGRMVRLVCDVHSARREPQKRKKGGLDDECSEARALLFVICSTLCSWLVPFSSLLLSSLLKHSC